MRGTLCGSQIIDEMLDLKKYARKPQYLMAPETPLLLFSCGYQGLSFHCHPGIYLHVSSLTFKDGHEYCNYVLRFFWEENIC
jgi:hypothetical protein